MHASTSGDWLVFFTGDSPSDSCAGLINLKCSLLEPSIEVLKITWSHILNYLFGSEYHWVCGGYFSMRMLLRPVAHCAFLHSLFSAACKSFSSSELLLTESLSSAVSSSQLSASFVTLQTETSNVKANHHRKQEKKSFQRISLTLQLQQAGLDYRTLFQSQHQKGLGGGRKTMPAC